MTDELSVDSAPIRPVREEGLLNSSVWWRPIETAPHNANVLLYCPERCQSNSERIELGYASHGWRIGVASTISVHPWATHWMPLPEPPTP